MMEPVDAGNGILHLLGNLRFEPPGPCTELRDQNRYEGNVDVWISRDRQLDEAEVSDRRDRQSDDNGSDRVSDRPCRDIHRHSLSPSPTISSTSKIVPVERSYSTMCLVRECLWEGQRGMGPRLQRPCMSRTAIVGRAGRGSHRNRQPAPLVTIWISAADVPRQVAVTATGNVIQIRPRPDSCRLEQTSTAWSVPLPSRTVQWQSEPRPAAAFDGNASMAADSDIPSRPFSAWLA